MPINIFVNIIESPKDSEIYNNTSEATLLKKAIELNNIPCISRVAINKSNFFKGICEGFIEGLKKYKYIPILHISCHGSANGIQLSCGDEIYWDEIRDRLMLLNKYLDGSLLLCLSTCEGFNACKMAMREKTSQYPFLALVGNIKSPTWPEAAIAYATFYYLIINKHTIEDAISAMCAASGNKDWVKITYLEAQQTYMNYLKRSYVKTE
jgi:hypothetical protein